jgi:outer membrane immunogenic protein
LLGGGYEYAFGNNWSAKVEYNYMNFGTDRLMFLPDDKVGPFDNALQIHSIKVGFNYLFRPSAVVAAY